jgi:hypothetical protein
MLLLELYHWISYINCHATTCTGRLKQDIKSQAFIFQGIAFIFVGMGFLSFGVLTIQALK